MWLGKKRKKQLVSWVGYHCDGQATTGRMGCTHYLPTHCLNLPCPAYLLPLPSHTVVTGTGTGTGVGQQHACT